MKKETTPKVKSITKNRVQIIGDNVLYNNGIITAFYLLPTTNYSTASADGVLKSITELTNLLSNLASQRPNITFTISRIEKTIRAKDVKSNLIDTIKLYREDYEMPSEFSYNIQDDLQEYSLLGIDIQQKEFGNIEEYTFKETIKELFGAAVDKLTGLGNLKVDVEKILTIEQNIYSVIRHRCPRASKELVFYNYVSKLYPCYEISYDKISFINEDNFEGIMGSVTQIVADNFGWFCMYNNGVELFDLEMQPTYGCVIDIKKFPDKIMSYNFPMDYSGCTTTIRCLKKDEAALKLKRARSADKYELSQAEEAEAESEQTEVVATSIALASKALSEIEEGDIMCQFNCSILVTAISREELYKKIAVLMSDLKDRNILASKSLNQALDFLDVYVGLRPSKYNHFASLQFPLSFQQNNGSIVGDSGTGVFSPSIGEDLS